MPLILALSGCAEIGAGWPGPGSWWPVAARLEVWAAPEGALILPDAPREAENEVYSGGEGRIRLAGAVNETVAFQVVFRSPTSASVNQVALDDFRAGQSVIPAGHVAFFREHRVPVEEYPAWFLRLTPFGRHARRYPDVLVPLAAPRGGLPIALRPREAEAVWADVHIPPGTPPGRYESRLTVLERLGPRISLPVALEVWPFALPQARHLPVLAGLDARALIKNQLEVSGRPHEPGRLSFEDPLYSKATAVLDAACRLLHDHRCCPVLRDVHPVADPEGGLNWADYDRLVSALVDGAAFEDRQPAAAWPLPVDDRFPPPEVYGGWGSPGHERALVDFLRHSAAHFESRGWLDRHLVWIPLPPTPPEERYRQFARLGRLVRSADERLRLLCPLVPFAMTKWGGRDEGFEEVSPWVGVWAPPGRLLDGRQIARERAAGRPTWLEPDRPPFSGSLAVFATPEQPRSVAWQAVRLGCDGVILASVNDEPAREEPGASFERCLIRPGRPYGLDQAIPTIRLKRLRRGVQDAEYLWLLERHRRPGIARRIAADLFPFGGTAAYGDHALDGRPGSWASEPDAWALARRLMAAEIIEAASQTATRPAFDEAAGIERFERQIEWARFTGTVRKVRIEIEGVRVRLASADEPHAASLEATVTLRNATPDPAAGRLVLADAPAGWQLRDDAEALPPLAAFQNLQTVLTIDVPRLAPGVDGTVPLRLDLRRGQPEPDTGQGRVAFLISQRLLKPLQIDGRLDDWPLGAGNVAGDFILVGALDVPKQGRSRPDRPTQQTTCFVAHDDQALYVAFFCADDAMTERRIARDNVVHYDDLWPTGDDLVEIVLDPTGQARSPGDLFHVAVKSNGAVVAERGVPPLATVAPWSDWPARIAAAVDDRTHADRWTVEVRIGLDALGPRAEIVGMNFARLLPRLGEYASWSGARRYLYCPVGLGNVHLPAP